MYALKNYKTVYHIPIDMVHSGPSQPRSRFDDAEMTGLCQSVKENGILQPISVVIDDAGGYSVVAGERRLRAARMAGFESVPCIILHASPEKTAVLSLVENLQRSDLTVFEEAEGLEKLMAYYHLTQEEVAKRVGKTQPAVANKLRLLQLTDEQKEIIVNSHLTERHARALLSVPKEKRDDVLKQIILKNLNVVQTENLVKLMAEAPPKRKQTPPLFRDVRLFANTINHAVTVMKNSGISATCHRTDFGDRLEYHIVIPK